MSYSMFSLGSQLGKITEGNPDFPELAEGEMQGKWAGESKGWVSTNLGQSSPARSPLWSTVIISPNSS